MKPGAWWPVAVIGVLGVTVAANAYLLIRANDPNAAAVEPDYYRRALNWDSTAAIQAASDRLGWNADAAIGALDPAGRARVAVRVTDAAGATVRGAEVRVTLVHNLDAERHVEALLPPAGDAYAATLVLRHPGLWELRVRAARDSAHFVADLRRDTGTELRP